ncbi:MAG TPA: bifunctional UDP-4-keto-pentose/UDP-xylose synthase [Candidatus Polarisedimenticolaceae bacterium]|nr:bifunctional UDP-4-keto-pentose/UDP-xylose synthase [Candidatus Polarisedimenticolaceae bacterium]
MKVLILGVNGFIGNSLVRTILERTDWEVSGIDLADDKLDHSLGHPRFEFHAGDIAIDRDWVDARIRTSDVVLPLVAIATPMAYVRQPLRVFELTFEENLRVIRCCATHGKRLVFPSTSEVYGMCDEAEFLEDHSKLVLGPISKQRWIYACSKQLLDRVIWAYGEAGALEFTLVRPFNWIGPRLDDPQTAKEGSSRVVTQFIANLVAGEPIKLVDGGRQRRCLTYIDDGIDALLRILEDPQGRARNQIFNIGSPDNEISMRELAQQLLRLFRQHPLHRHDGSYSAIVDVGADDYYGPGYQDIVVRRPSIEKARRLLGWEPRVTLESALRRTLEAYLESLAPAG